MKLLLLFASVVAVAFAAPEWRSSLPRLDGRIVGGNETTIEQYNYQCSLLIYEQHFCGCFIISPLFAITAAHCTDYMSISYLAVRAGSSIIGSGGVVVPLRAFHQHPYFDYDNLDYDISILHLLEELVFGASIGSIPLPDQDQEVAPGTPAVVTGWGTTAENGSLSPQLQSVEVPIVSIEQCKEAYSLLYPVTEGMICAGFLEEGGKDHCNGDSGGPLVADGVVVGVVSWAYGCARPHYPGVYSNVAKFRGFINEITGL